MIDFKTLRLSAKPNQYLVAPRDFTAAAAHRESPVYRLPALELARRFRALALAQPRVRLLAEADGGRRFELVQRSALFRFPDTVSVEAVALGENRSALAIYSRSRFGYSDFGANRKRIESWLAQLATRV